MADIKSDYKEKDVTILRKTLKINRPGRFAIKKID